VPKCVVGDRYKVTGDQFDEDSDDDEPHPDFFYGVVIAVQKTGCKMLFYEDETPTRYNGFLEEWVQYRVDSDLNNAFEELLFQDLEIRGKLRAKPRPPARSVATPARSDNAGDSDSEGTTDDDEAVVEGDAEDDECDVEPTTKGKLRAKPRPPPKSVATDNAGDSEATTNDEKTQEALHLARKLLQVTRKHFIWLGKDKKTSAELHEGIAIALIQHQLLGEAQRNEDLSDDDSEPDLNSNSMSDCRQHPQYKKNLCRVCYTHKTIYYCTVCSNPQQSTLRRDTGPKGGQKFHTPGYMHFCKHKGCFAKHKCGSVPRRRTKATMATAAI